VSRMGGTAALRDVGETLVQIIRGVVDPAVIDPANVRLAMPRDFESLDASTDLAVSLFLYRVAVIPELRNAAMRPRPVEQLARPPLPVSLGFLITPWARDASNALLLAGTIARALYDRSELTSSELVGGPWAPTDSVQLVIDDLPVSDHYRIWETTKVPYRLSLTYLARVIGIDPAEASAFGRVLDADIGLTRR